MFDYLQQFNNLPQNLRNQVSSPSAMSIISELEAKYKVDLAIVVMKVMVKSLSFSELSGYLSGELSLAPETAQKLVAELKEKLFAPLADYLGLSSEMRALDLDKDIEAIIKEAGLVLPSTTAISRFKNIIAIYVRGIRSKIDTRNTLAKDIKIGGLNLTPVEIDRVLKICDTRVSKVSAPAISASLPIAAPATRLDKIISSVDKTSAPVSPEYNLKQALAKGETKPVKSVPLDTKHELTQPEKQLDLPQPQEKAKLTAPQASPVIPKVAAIAPAPAPVKKSQILTPIKSSVSTPAVPAPVLAKAPVLASVKAPTPAPVSPAAARNLAGQQAPAPSTARPQMHDIKPMPKVMGPIEELQFLDVINFRRLGATPAEITAKVLAKIKLLEKDGYDKMVAGVRAWRQSPVSRLYLRLGQEAIAKGLTMKAMVESRKGANQEYLSMEEIEAIVSLNGKLVF